MSVTFLRLGQKGNLGNQLFQIASTIGIAAKSGQRYCFPNWKFNNYLESSLPIISERVKKDWTIIKEKQFNYYDLQLKQEDVSLEGWFQTEKYFYDIDVKSIFSFKKELKDKLYAKYDHLFTKKTVLISVRRGDFVDNKYYFQTSYRFYLTALLKYFPDFDHYNFIFTSDDIEYCKEHFGKLPNAFFLENLSAPEQLIIAENFDNFIISNSTFSWWIAWLGEKKHSKVICPERNFDGPYSVKYNEKDYFCDRWIKHTENDISIPIKYKKIVIKGEIILIKQRIRNFFKKHYYKLKGWPTDLR